MLKEYPVYGSISVFSFEAVERTLRSPNAGRDPIIQNMACAMTGMLSAGAVFVRVLEAAMPRTLSKIDKDILALDTLAYVTATMQQALTFRHRRDRSEGTERAWLSTVSVAKTLKENFVERFGSGLDAYWLDRWNEFRSVEDPHERFTFLIYLLYTSKGHHAPQHRYPGSPPVLLELEVALESMPAELACAETMLSLADAFEGLGALMART